MKVVALVSGGKDSLASLWKCLQYGHDVVCVANLSPEDDAEEELDSFCFQTVGHRCIEAIAGALDLPLVRGGLRRDTSNVTSLAYPAKPTDREDEVERLFDLLRAVMRRFPEVTAVSSGAILSNYQRLRVESVCARLGLVSLAYLWQRDEDEYVDELAEEGFEAKIVKVASMGLLLSDLGKNLSDISDRLKGMEHCHTAGEGGEYETVVTDCPLFRTTRLRVADASTVVSSSDKFAPVGHLTFSVHPEPKAVPPPAAAAKPPVVSPNVPFANPTAPQLPAGCPGGQAGRAKRWRSPCGKWTVNAGLAVPGSDAAPLDRATADLLDGVSGDLPDAVFVHVYGASIDGFAQVNRGYVPHFDVNPPSRAFVEVSGTGARVVVDVLAYAGPRETLHVQSVSEWAPACIGPYAQATAVGGTVLHAGMLGLDPATMALVSEPVADGAASDEQRTAALRGQVPRALRSYGAVMPVVKSSLKLVRFGVAYVLAPGDFAFVAEEWRAAFEKLGVAAPALVVTCVSALPKHAAFELQLMSAALGAPAAAAGGAPAPGRHYVQASFGEMTFAACAAADAARTVAELAAEGLAVGHVKLLLAEPDLAFDTAGIPETIPVTVLPSAGSAIVHLSWPSLEPCSLAILWAVPVAA
ncbi:Diphthine--ammonia ligase [Diplonema papillatum]|nr:Diphthine--ammonia ligase [Diplonema papillatum]